VRNIALALLASLFSYEAAHAATLTVTGSKNLTYDYGASVAGAAVGVSISGTSLTRGGSATTMKIDQFDPSLGTLNNIVVQNFLFGSLVLERFVVVEGTVLADFDVDVRGDVYFDFPEVDETPFALGPPVNINGPLTRPAGRGAFKTQLDREASLPLTPFFIDVGPTKPTASLGPTDASSGLFPDNRYSEMLDYYTGTGQVDVTVGLSSTAGLDIECYGAGACQAGVSSFFDIQFDTKVFYEYTPAATTDPNDGNGTIGVVPLPASGLLLMFGVGCLGVCRRKWHGKTTYS
jgi:hypothetical protein